MYPYFQIAEPTGKGTVFMDCYIILDMEHPETGKRYLLTKHFPTLDECTRAVKTYVPDAECIVETFLPRKNSKLPQRRWHQIPRHNAMELEQ
jgi:hypothetical protein